MHTLLMEEILNRTKKLFEIKKMWSGHSHASLKGGVTKIDFFNVSGARWRSLFPLQHATIVTKKFNSFLSY